MGISLPASQDALGETSGMGEGTGRKVELDTWNLGGG